MIRNSIRLGSAALAALAVSLAPAAIAQAKAKTKCLSAGAQTLASDSYARVYGLNGQAYVCVKSSGKRTLLTDATPGADTFALGGKYVGWSWTDSSDSTIPRHSVITVMHIPDHSVDSYYYPFYTNEQIDKIVVVADGAAAWALTPLPNDDAGNPIVQGTDRKGHPPDQLSDDSEGSNLVGASLHVISGTTIGWSYADGKTGTATLY